RGGGHEGGLVAGGQHEERVRAVVCGQVVLGAGDGHGRDDGHAERRADLQGGVAQARGEAGLVPGDAGERGDRGGHGSPAAPQAAQKQPRGNVGGVAARRGEPGGSTSDPAPISARPAAATGRKPALWTAAWPAIAPAVTATASTTVLTPNLRAE